MEAPVTSAGAGVGVGSILGAAPALPRFSPHKERTMIEFDDGESLDASGPPRVEQRADGLYVVGRDCVIPVTDEAEAAEVVAELRRLPEGQED